ncbi:MAG: hypothetical protein ACOVNL_03935 [Prochlorococcaceae cyanobacterium]|jgi:hypothetical protein
MNSPVPHQPDPASGLEEFQVVLLDRLDKLERKLDRLSLNGIRQMEAFIQLHAMLGPIPAPLHGWAISADLALLLVRLIQEQPPDLVVEFGSGVSTYVLLAALARAGVTQAAADDIPGRVARLLAFEHLPKCHAITQELIHASPLCSIAEVRSTPLEPWGDTTGDYLFYGELELISSSLLPLRQGSRPIKMLVLVDGPPGRTNPWARYPALPALLAQIEQGSGKGPPLCVELLLDDFERTDERQIARAWEEDLCRRGLMYARREPVTENGTLHLSWKMRL